MKVAVLVVVLANFAVFAWLRWAPPFAPPPDAGLVPPTSAGAPLVVLARGSRGKPGCLLIGPAQDATAAGALALQLRHRGYAAQSTPRQVSAPTGYWVLLTGFVDVDAAHAAAARLRRGGIRDLFILNGATGGSTSISLGLFRDLAHARDRARHAQALGFRPELRERFRSAPRWYVQVHAPVDVTALAASAGTRARPASCARAPAGGG